MFENLNVTISLNEKGKAFILNFCILCGKTEHNFWATSDKAYFFIHAYSANESLSVGSKFNDLLSVTVTFVLNGGFDEKRPL